MPWLDTAPGTDSSISRPKRFEPQMKRTLGHHPSSPSSRHGSYSRRVLPVSTDCCSELYNEPASSFKTPSYFQEQYYSHEKLCFKNRAHFFLNKMYTCHKDAPLTSRESFLFRSSSSKRATGEEWFSLLPKIEFCGFRRKSLFDDQS